MPDASRFPDILVTEIQAFVRRPAAAGRGTLARTTQLVNTDVRMRLLDAPSLYYEGYYLYNGTDAPGSKRDTLSNGFSVNHSFARIFSLYGRGALEQGTQPEGHRVATVTNATLTIAPLPTFRSSVLFTGQNERIGEIPNDRRGLFVQNTAQIYKGVDVLFGFGWNVTTRETGEVLHDRLTNLSATIVPRQRLALTFSFDDTTSERSGTFVGSPRTHARRGYATVAVDPFPTLHLVLGEEVIVVTGDKTRDHAPDQRELGAVSRRHAAVPVRVRRGAPRPGVRAGTESARDGALEPVTTVVHRRVVPEDQERVRPLLDRVEDTQLQRAGVFLMQREATA